MEVTLINSILGSSALVGVAYLTARMNRPAQQETAEKEFRASLIDCAKMAPELMQKNSDLMVANARYQDTLEDRDRTIEDRDRTIKTQAEQLKDVSDRLDTLEKQVPGLRGQITTLKREVGDLKKQIAERDVELAATRETHAAELSAMQAERDAQIAAAQDLIDRLNIQIDIALRAQERAEGALSMKVQSSDFQAADSSPIPAE